MEVHTIATRDTLREIRKYLVNPKIKKFYYICSVIMLLAGFLAAAAGIYHISVAFLLVIVVLLIELYITSWGVLRKTMKVIHELHNTDMVEGKAIFGEDKLKSISFASKGEVNISYSAMMKFAETKNYYAMFTKEYVTLIIDKQQFTPETEMQFLQVVREKMPQILKGKKFKTI